MTAIVAAGIGSGINTTITFVPVIAAMFLFLALLERSGYMARAAFVVDRLMQGIGLPGKSFVPMIVGFGCNVPAIMGTRTLENAKDRILTAMMTPFMSCGARLAIYAVFVATFFKAEGAIVVFSLYITGIIIAVLTGLILRLTLLQGQPAPFVMELPPYHAPSVTALMLQAWQRTRAFIFKAGRFIIPICVLISALNAVDIHGRLLVDQRQADQSALAVLGRTITPVFSAFGIRQDNWPATVGLVTGVLAKEVVVGTLNTLYSSQAHWHQPVNNNGNFWGDIRDALYSVPANLAALKDSWRNPIVASEASVSVDSGVLGLMAQHFHNKAAAFAYLLFILLYVPCVSTVAVIAKEISRGWAWFSSVWSIVLAYGVAVIFYQVAMFKQQPLVAGGWIASILILFAAIIIGLQLVTQRRFNANALRGEL